VTQFKDHWRNFFDGQKLFLCFVFVLLGTVLGCDSQDGGSTDEATPIVGNVTNLTGTDLVEVVIYCWDGLSQCPPVGHMSGLGDGQTRSFEDEVNTWDMFELGEIVEFTAHANEVTSECPYQASFETGGTFSAYWNEVVELDVVFGPGDLNCVFVDLLNSVEAELDCGCP